MSAPVKWPEDRVNLLVSMHSTGRTSREIATALKCSRTAVQNKISEMKRADLPPDDGLPWPKPTRKWPKFMWFDDMPRNKTDRERVGKPPSRQLDQSMVGCSALSCVRGGV